MCIIYTKYIHTCVYVHTHTYTHVNLQNQLTRNKEIYYVYRFIYKITLVAIKYHYPLDMAKSCVPTMC